MLFTVFGFARCEHLRLQVAVNWGATAMMEGNFGTLELTENGRSVIYEAVQVHLTASSLHTVNGEYKDRRR